MEILSWIEYLCHIILHIHIIIVHILVGVGAFSSQDANCPMVAFIKVVAGDANRPSSKITGMGMMMAMMVPEGWKSSICNARPWHPWISMVHD